MVLQWPRFSSIGDQKETEALLYIVRNIYFENIYILLLYTRPLRPSKNGVFGLDFLALAQKKCG